MRELLLAWGRATGTTFSEDDLAMMTASIVATAWMTLGSAKDDWKDIDDTVEPEAELTSVLGDQAVEAFVNAGSGQLIGPDGPRPDDPVEAYIWAGGGEQMPSSVDEAIETGNLDVYVNGPTPLSSSDWDTPGDWFRNIVFDWEAFYGENASVGGSAIQIVGVLPFGKGAQVLRTMRWVDEGAELTGDVARFWNGLGLSDDAVAALDGHTFDGVGTLGDELAESAYTVGGRQYDAVFSAQTVVDNSGVTGQQMVERVLEDSSVFDDLGVEPWTVDETLTAINTPPSQLTDEQATVLQHLREEIGLPEEGTVLQRIIPYGESQLVLENNAVAYPTTVMGFVAPAQDAVQFGTPAEVVDSLGLGYVDESGALVFSPDEPVVRAIRFPATQDVLARADIPRVSDLGGSGLYDGRYDWPFTGNGFTSSPDAIVPEIRIETPAKMPEGSEMWEIAADGTERLVGVYDGRKWVRADG